MSGRIDLTGKLFGRLTVLGYSHTEKTRSVWRCLCDCGKTKLVDRNSLKRGNSRSCGCLFKEILLNHNTTHKKAHTSEYKIWIAMKSRCYNKRTINFESYGARGITVCDEWKNDFLQFLKDMGNRPSIKHSLERIDNNGNYEPTNCCWATRFEQNINRRIPKTNKSGFKGVYQSGSKWVAEIRVNGTSHYLGSFKSTNDAVLARKEAETKYWGKSS